MGAKIHRRQSFGTPDEYVDECSRNASAGRDPKLQDTIIANDSQPIIINQPTMPQQLAESRIYRQAFRWTVRQGDFKWLIEVSGKRPDFDRYPPELNKHNRTPNNRGVLKFWREQ